MFSAGAVVSAQLNGGAWVSRGLFIVRRVVPLNAFRRARAAMKTTAVSLARHAVGASA